jgi:hypothetical protein
MHHTPRATACCTCLLAPSRTRCLCVQYSSLSRSDTHPRSLNSQRATPLSLPAIAVTRPMRLQSPRSPSTSPASQTPPCSLPPASAERIAVLCSTGARDTNPRFQRQRHATAVTRPTRLPSPRPPSTSPASRAPPCSLPSALAERICRPLHARERHKRQPVTGGDACPLLAAEIVTRGTLHSASDRFRKACQRAARAAGRARSAPLVSCLSPVTSVFRPHWRPHTHTRKSKVPKIFQSPKEKKKTASSPALPSPISFFYLRFFEYVTKVGLRRRRVF